MTILIPMAIVGLIVGGLGYYFALHEGESQHAKIQRGAGVRISQPDVPTNPDPAGREQSAGQGPQGPAVNGVPLHG